MADRYVRVGIEAVDGTPVAPNRNIMLIGGGLPGESGIIHPVVANTRFIPRPKMGHWVNKGGWNQYVGSENIGEILYCGIGAPTITQPDAPNAPSVYDHEFLPLNVLKTLTTEIGKDHMAHEYQATTIRGFEIAMATKQIMEMTVDAYAWKDKKNALPGALAYQPFDWFVFSQAVPKINDVANDLIRNMTLRCENVWDEENYVLGSRTIKRNVLQEFKVTGRVDLQFENSELLAKFWGKAGAEEPITLEDEWEFDKLALEALTWIANPGETTELNAKLTVTMPKITWDSAVANVDKRNNIIQNMTFTAVNDETLGAPIKFELRNTIPSWI